jgi:hypothetical protein
MLENKCPESCADCWKYNEFAKYCTILKVYIHDYTKIPKECPYLVHTITIS